MRRISQRLDPDLINVLLLLIFCLVAYSNSFNSTFHFDDIPQILANDALHDFADVGRVYSHCKERLLTNLTLAFNYKTGGFEPLDYHIVNFFIHYFAGFFLYFLCIQIWKTPGMESKEFKWPVNCGAFLVAGVFLLHPLQTQAVTYIIQRAESMAGMFYIAALYFYLKVRLAQTRMESSGYFILMVLAGLCSAFSKETAVTLPALIVVFEIFFFNTAVKDLARSRVVLLMLVPAGIIVAYKLGTLLRQDFFYDPAIPFTRKQYIFTQFSVLVTYIRLFFWPTGQNVDWDYSVAGQFFALQTFPSFLLLVLFILIGFFAYRKFRLVSLGIVAFFVTLAPTSSIIPIRDVIFEHRMYLAVAFLGMGCVQLLFWGLARIRERNFLSHRLAVSASIATILFLLAGLTYARNEVWLNELSLWEDAVRKSPNKARPHNNYGRALYLFFGNSMLKKAKHEFEIATRLDPNWAIPFHNLAWVYFREGEYQEAIALDLEAIKRLPKYKESLYQLGRSHKKLNQWENARVYLERLINLSPGSKFLPVYVDLLDVYLELGLQDQALGLAGAMTRMPDTSTQADYFRGMAFYKLGYFGRAKMYFAKQTEKKKAPLASYLLLGQIHYQEDKYEEAELAFRRALEQQWWFPAANYNLALVLIKNKRFREASEHFEKTLEVENFSVAPRIHLIKLYSGFGNGSRRLYHFGKLFRLRSDSREFQFLRSNVDGDLAVILKDYEREFLSKNLSQSAGKIRAIIFTLREDYHAAIECYKRYLKVVSHPVEKKRVTQELLRLEEILQGGESLRRPA